MPEKEVAAQNSQSPSQSPESAILPAWLYPAFFWLALPTLLLSLLLPTWASVGVWYMMVVPALAALVVAVTQWQRDRQVSRAALLTLLGLVLVVIAKQFIHH